MCVLLNCPWYDLGSGGGLSRWTPPLKAGGLSRWTWTWVVAGKRSRRRRPGTRRCIEVRLGPISASESNPRHFFRYPSGFFEEIKRLSNQRNGCSSRRRLLSREGEPSFCCESSLCLTESLFGSSATPGARGSSKIHLSLVGACRQP